MKTLLFSLITLWGAVYPSSAAEPFRFEKDERIVLLGGTLIEREQKYGQWEAAITAMFPDKNLKFRNFGWSGDTVWGESRASFGTPADGFKKLVELTLEWKPTTIILGYGANESFAGEKGLKDFEAGYAKLLDALAPAKAKVIILSSMIPPLSPQSPERKAQIEIYRKSIQTIAANRKAAYADLIPWMAEFAKTQNTSFGHTPLSDDGMQYNSRGYEVTAGFWRSFLDADSKASLAISEPLREAIVAKNQLVFYRWRPQNETYLFGFRKHEQGKNGKEVFEFDPLIDSAEKAIMELKRK